ncbi:MAG: hypothetical protein WAO52_07685 [Prolixibacteraceae bacterium]
MKTIINTTICLLFFCSVYSNSKKDSTKFKNNTIIIQSVLSPNTKIPLFVGSNDQIILKFEDVNTFLYSINFKEVQRDLISDEEKANNILELSFNPSEIKFLPLKLTDFLLPEIQNPNVADTINELERTLTALQVKAKLLNDQRRKLNEELDGIIRRKLIQYELEIKDTINDVKALKLENKLLEIKSSDDIKKMNSSIDDLMKEFQSNLAALENNRKAKEKYISKNNSIEVHTILFRNLLKNYIDILSSINEKLAVYDELMFVLYSNEPFKNVELQKKQILKDHFGTDCEPGHILHSYYELFNKLDTVYYAIQKRYDLIPDKKQVSSSFIKLSDYHNKIDRVKYQEIFRQILKTFNAINESNWTITYQTTTISDKADKIFYSLDITPIKNEYTLTNKSIKFNYGLDINGGYKIDVSAGILYHFMLMDDEYRFEKVTEETSRIVKVTKDDQFTPAASALFNIYKRSASAYKLAVNFGAGTNTEKVYYYLGAGILLGKSERIGVSAGLVGGTVARISDEYKKNDIINLPLEKLTKEVVMQSKDPFKFGYYFGVTYNLSGKNKANMEAMLRK